MIAVITMPMMLAIVNLIFSPNVRPFQYYVSAYGITAGGK